MKVDCCVDLSQQMVRRNHLFQTYKFNLAAIFNIFRKHVHHPYSFYHFFALYEKKGHRLVTFFDKLSRAERLCFFLHIFIFSAIIMARR